MRIRNMRVFALVGLVLAAACGGSGPRPVTIASADAAHVPPDAGFAASGRIEAELASLHARGMNAREVELMAELARCTDARNLAGQIATKGDDAAKRAARAAVAECARLERTPTAEALAQLRAAFHEARRLEPADPRRAEKLYAEAWADAPSAAAMLGLARAAKAAGDAALAERSFETRARFATGSHVTLGQIGAFDERAAPTWADDSKRLIVERNVVGKRASRVYALAGRTFVAAGALSDDPHAFAFGPRGALWVAGFGVLSRVDLARRVVRTFSVDDGNCVDVVVSPDESLVAVRLEAMGIRVFDASGKRLASADIDQGAMRFEGRKLVVAGDASTEQVLDVDTQKVTPRPAGAVPAAPPGKWIARGGKKDGLIEVEDTGTHAIATIDLAGDAFVSTGPDGKGAIGGNEATAGCRVGSAWLPLETCRDRLVGSSPR